MANLNGIFSPKKPSVYFLQAGSSFLDNLAKTLIDELGASLSDAMIFLPTRRAVRSLAQALLAHSGKGASLLPILKPLGDMDENEPPFEPGDLALTVPPAIDSAHRKFALAALVAAKLSAQMDAPIPVAEALSMSEPLISVLNDLAMAEIDISVIEVLQKDMIGTAAHFQDAAEFMAILAQYWPLYLQDNKVVDPMTRRVALLRAAAKKWQETPPDFPVLVAGSTGTLPATANFIKTVSNLPKGCVVLPGLDTHLDTSSWDEIDEQHPQGALKNLISVLGISRQDIPSWPGEKPPMTLRTRERILTESLIPATSTSDWPTRIASIQKDLSGDTTLKDGLDGLSLIEAETPDEEAQTIALIMRKSVFDDKTCALVTPDPALARRVRAKLSRYDIDVDSSAGEPLEETRIGSFLSLSLNAAKDPFDPVALISLFAHPLMAKTNAQLTHWHQFEAKALRGARARDLDTLQKRLDGQCQEGLEIFIHLQKQLGPLTTMFTQSEVSANIWAKTHIEVLEMLAGGAENLWRDEAGEKAARVFEDLLANSTLLGTFDGEVYTKLLSRLMREQVVRPRYGTDPHLMILGPLEARMQNADQFILGGLNEGVWPAHPAPHPILSRGMRKKIGLGMPEKRFGLSAHDFAILAAKPKVILTRSKKTVDGPAVMSRWLWRLTTLVSGALVNLDALAPKFPYLDWARALDIAPEKPDLRSRPAPRPPVNARWPMGRKLSVTQFSKWIRDPYSLYAQYILGLKPLDLPDLPVGPAQIGSALHKALERFSKTSENQRDQLLTLMEEELLNSGFQPHDLLRRQPKLELMADWCVQFFKSRTANGWKQGGVEQRGRYKLEDLDFTITGQVDRIEICGDTSTIIDYKTGSAPSAKEVAAGFDPQLPLLAIMQEAGAFGTAHPVDDLLYVLPRERKENERMRSLCSGRSGTDAQVLMEKTRKDIQTLIRNFDQEATAYYAQPRAKFVNKWGDYDHLARRAEWATLLDTDGGGDG